jgi:hypothetical protein
VGYFVLPKKCIAKNQEFQGKVLRRHFLAYVIDNFVEVRDSVAVLKRYGWKGSEKFNYQVIYSGFK